MTSIQHVITRHGPNSTYPNVSKFISKLTERKAIKMAKQVFKGGIKENNSLLHDFGRVIGTDRNGNPTTYVIIHLNHLGQIRTMFPY